MALSSWVLGVRSANVELSRICLGSAHSRWSLFPACQAAWRESTAVLPFAVSGIVSVISQLTHFELSHLWAEMGFVCLFVVCYFEQRSSNWAVLRILPI